MEHKTLFNSKVDLSEFKNKNQDSLTIELDKLSGDFDQTTINKIVLWKVSRYAEIDDDTFELLNSIDKSDVSIDSDKIRQILERLLKRKGIGLPMASTILRFKNPNVFQIIDQHAYRIINKEQLTIPTNIEKQIDLYLDYLRLLKKVCAKEGIPFSQSDRILYWADKNLNPNIPIKY
jgi:thermostable 8-oxoguanine DNA glycosylase